MDKKSISVWLILQDGKNKGKIALQKRSQRDRSFRYVCQGTWAGKAKVNENLASAISRECSEELGKKFCENFNQKRLRLFAKSRFIRGKDKWICFHYSGKVSGSLLKKAKIHRNALPEFIFAGKKDKIYSIKLKTNAKENIVVFDDQYKIIKKLLKRPNGNKK
jgi:hypothetical protein